MRNFAIIQCYYGQRKRGLLNFAVYFMGVLLRRLHVDNNFGVAFRKKSRGPATLAVFSSPVPYDGRLRDNQTIYIQALKTGWGFPWRVHWIAQTVSHEVVHKVVEKIENDPASIAIDHLSDELWEEYC